MRAGSLKSFALPAPARPATLPPSKTRLQLPPLPVAEAQAALLGCGCCCGCCHCNLLCVLGCAAAAGGIVAAATAAAAAAGTLRAGEHLPGGIHCPPVNGGGGCHILGPLEAACTAMAGSEAEHHLAMSQPSWPTTVNGAGITVL